MWWLRIGKQKVPFGWERTIGISEQFLPERSISSQLTSNRDEGVLVTGEFGDGLWESSIGAFNGVPDGAGESLRIQLAFHQIALRSCMHGLAGHRFVIG